MRRIFEQLDKARQNGVAIRRHEFNYALSCRARNRRSGPGLDELSGTKVLVLPDVARSLRRLRPSAPISRRFGTNDMVFGVGPAGTGKTYLAMAMAVTALKQEKVARIILTRPAVEAGEALGFLPGDLKEKIMPYLRPLYDALQDMLEPEEMQRYMERNVIEIAPLAYMRGRTLSARLRRARRGAEHDDRADVHVPHTSRRGLQMRGHGRPHPDRSSGE